MASRHITLTAGSTAYVPVTDKEAAIMIEEPLGAVIRCHSGASAVPSDFKDTYTARQSYNYWGGDMQYARVEFSPGQQDVRIVIDEKKV